jgi:UDP-glucose 4-epimerase
MRRGQEHGLKILVTGGAGFIGSHLTRALVAQGMSVTVLDIAGRPACLPDHLEIDYRAGSILDHRLTDRLIQRTDLVVHLAGIAEPLRYGSAPLQTMDVTLCGSIAVVRRCAEFAIPVLFASTSEIYGINPALPWPETADRVLGPVANMRWCYATAKAAVEHYLDACRQDLGLNHTIVRLFNAYGSGLKGRVVDGFIRQALAGEPLVIHGDGLQTRSFCYIDDVVDALLRIIARPIIGGDTYNIGADIETPIVDLARLVIELTASRSTLRMLPQSQLYPGFQQVPRRRPEIAAIRRAFGWTPTTALRAGLDKMIAAMRQGEEIVHAA